MTFRFDYKDKANFKIHGVTTCNQFHNILRPFNVLTNVPLTTRKTMGDYNLQTCIYELSHKLQNGLRLRILGN